MKLKKQYTYYADREQARISLFKGDKQYYIRLEVFCKQAQELVTSDFALGKAEELRERWIAWQNKGHDHASQFGKVSVGTLSK